jgi:16S rRNA (uracil1498-N3)-methyltransferase
VSPQRFHVRPEAIEGSRLTFDEQEARHIVRVLRLRTGALVAAVDGTGREYAVRLERVTRHTVIGTVLGSRRHDTESPLHITLAQGVPRSDKMDHIVRAATELGVGRIVPILAGRTIVHQDASRWRERARRWQRIAREASKQSGRSTLPEVDDAVTLSAFLSGPTLPTPTGLRLCCWEGATGGLREALEAARPRPAAAGVLIGPEGGFTAEEVEQARAHGFTVVGLGPRILRAETAGPAVVAVLQAAFGDLAA